MTIAQTTQIVQVGIFLAIVIGFLVLAYIIGPWVRAHRTAVEATAASIGDADLRAKAQEVVRWLEQDPDQMFKSGLEQRNAGIAMLTSLLGVPAPEATVALDAAYQTLSLAGQIVRHDPPPVATAVNVGELATALAAALAPQKPPEPPPAGSPVPLTPPHGPDAPAAAVPNSISSTIPVSATFTGGAPVVSASGTATIAGGPA